eukprot:tig00000492_g1422.t1
MLATVPGARRGTMNYTTARALPGEFAVLSVRQVSLPGGRVVSLVAVFRAEGGAGAAGAGGDLLRPVSSPQNVFGSQAFAPCRMWLGPAGPRCMPSAVQALRSREILPYAVVHADRVLEFGARLFGILEEGEENGVACGLEMVGGGLGAEVEESLRPFRAAGARLPAWHPVYQRQRPGGGGGRG